MRRYLTIFSVVMACLLFASCRHKETYAFLNSTDEIICISVVKISFSDNGEVIQTLVSEIKDTKAFLDDFRAVDCYTHYSDPLGISPGGTEDTVIQFFYKNDEYELINWLGQAKYTSEYGFRYYAGYSVFDEMQFEALIEKYTSN